MTLRSSSQRGPARVVPSGSIHKAGDVQVMRLQYKVHAEDSLRARPMKVYGLLEVR